MHLSCNKWKLSGGGQGLASQEEVTALRPSEQNLWGEEKKNQMHMNEILQKQIFFWGYLYFQVLNQIPNEKSSLKF